MTEPAASATQAWESRGGVLRHGRWSVWLPWVAYTVVGYLLRGLLVLMVPVRGPGDVALASVIGALGLGVVALLQWSIFRLYLGRVKWFAWVGATVVGQIAATVLVTLAVAGPLLLGLLTPLVKYIEPSAFQVTTRVITGSLLGAVLGFAQWLVLRRHLSPAVVSFVTPAPGLGLSFDRAPMVTAQVISGVIVGAITGTTLIWLLRKAPQVTSHPSADPAR
jgi:hypothetical protein